MTDQEARDFAVKYPTEFAEIVHELGFAVSNREFAAKIELHYKTLYEAKLRDQYMIAALTGLMSISGINTETAVARAFEVADIAIRQR